MAVPADLATLARSWRLSSSVEGNGWQADQCTIEYASLSLADYHAVADTLNAAAATDTFAIVVMIDTIPWEIFRGTVVTWELQERFTASGRETIGVLQAQDARGVMNRTRAPDNVTYRGVEIHPLTGVRTAHDYLSTAMGSLCGLAGIAVVFEFDYPLTQNVVTAAMSIGQAVAHLLEPAQRTEGLRADFVRRGSTYLVRLRTIPLGTPELTIDASLVKVRRYRKTRPTPPFTPHDLQPATERNGLTWNVDWPEEDAGICTDYEFENGFGRSCSFYDNGRLSATENSRTITAPNGATSTTVTRTVYGYDTRGRPTGNSSDTTQDGVLIAQTITTITYDTTGRHRLEVTRTRRRNREGAMVTVEVSSTAKNETGAGSYKVYVSDRITATGVLGGLVNISEFSSGDLSGNPERRDRGPNLRNEPDDVLDPSAQIGRALLECSVDVPFDPRIYAGMTIEFSGSPSLVTENRFYVVGYEAGWQKPGPGQAGTHDMTLQLEAWVT